MGRTLSEEDIEAIALRVVKLIGARLTAPDSRPEAFPPTLSPPQPEKSLQPKLAYSLKELMDELGLSRVTLYRLEVRGLLKPLPYFRHKVFSRDEVERFLAGQAGDSRPLEKLGRRNKLA